MKKIVLANASYPYHITDEGEQLQRGLQHAGWKLCGPHYDDNGGDVPAILAAEQPDVVLIQQPSDWDEAVSGSFGRHDLHFYNIDALASHPCIKIGIVKDAGGPDYQRMMAETMGYNAIVTYSHRDSVLGVAPWVGQYPTIRTYHTVDASFVKGMAWPLLDRDLGVVTGAASENVYPLRRMAFHHAAEIGIVAHSHPGYTSKRCYTTEYLEMLMKYRVHVATASKYHFALRKIIESVAVGCTPLTNLPTYDVLPVIDGALARVQDDIGLYNFKREVRRRGMEWVDKERREWSEKCLRFYDYRAMGRRLDADIERVVRELAGH